MERRFLRGPNIHGQRPCVAVEVDLDNHRSVGLEDLPGGAALFRALMPHDAAPADIDAEAAARLLARLMFTMQVAAGCGAQACDTVSVLPKASGRFRLVCGFQDEVVAGAALRLSVELVTALLRRAPFDLEARLVELRMQADARASGTGTQAPPSARAGHHQIPVVAITGTNGKTTTTQLIAQVMCFAPAAYAASPSPL